MGTKWIGAGSIRQVVYHAGRWMRGTGSSDSNSNSRTTSVFVPVSGNAATSIGDPVFSFTPRLVTDEFEVVSAGDAPVSDSQAYSAASTFGRHSETVVWDHGSAEGFLAFYPTSGSLYYLSDVTLTEKHQDLADASGWETSAGWSLVGDDYVRSNGTSDPIYGEYVANDCRPETAVYVAIGVDYVVTFRVSVSAPGACTLSVGFVDSSTGEPCGDQVLVDSLSTVSGGGEQGTRSVRVSSKSEAAKIKIVVNSLSAGSSVTIDSASLTVVADGTDRTILSSDDTRSWRNSASSTTENDYVGWVASDFPIASSKRASPSLANALFVPVSLVSKREYLLEYSVYKDPVGTQGNFVFPFFWEDGLVAEGVSGKLLIESGPVARRCPFDDFHRRLTFKKDVDDVGPIDGPTTSCSNSMGDYGPWLLGTGGMGFRKAATGDVLRAGNKRLTVEKVLSDNVVMTREDVSVSSDGSSFYVVRSEEVFDNLRFPQMTAKITGTVEFTGENFVYTIPDGSAAPLVWATRMLGTGTSFLSEIVPGLVSGVRDPRHENDLLYCKNHNYVVLEVKSDTEMILALWGHTGYVDPNSAVPPPYSYHDAPKAESGLSAYVEARRVDLIRDYDDADWSGDVHASGNSVIWDSSTSPEDLPGGVRPGVYATIYFANAQKSLVGAYYDDAADVAAADAWGDSNTTSLEKLSEELEVGDGVYVGIDVCEVFYVGEDYMFDDAARAAVVDPSYPPKWDDTSVVWPVLNTNNTPVKMVRVRQLRPRRWLSNSAHPTASLAKVKINEDFVEAVDPTRPGEGYLASTFSNSLVSPGAIGADHPTVDRWGDVFGVGLAYEADYDNYDPKFDLFKIGLRARQF